MRITRREGLLGAAALGFAPRALAAPPTALDTIGKPHGVRFGTSVGMREFPDPRYRALIEAECGVIVPENELKMYAIQPHGPDDFAFAKADMLVDYATKHGLLVRGHNLIWHHPKFMPRWAETLDYGPRPADRVTQILTRHIDTVCRRYGTRIYTWDVVNEAVDNHSGALRETAFSRAMGSPEAVLDLAFHAARTAVPHAELVYIGAATPTAPACCACSKASASAACPSIRSVCKATSPPSPASRAAASARIRSASGGASSMPSPAWATSSRLPSSMSAMPRFPAISPRATPPSPISPAPISTAPCPTGRPGW
jgi:hypothetical protein